MGTRDYTTRYFHGTRVHVPVVLLENRLTGQRIWFTNHHNPADTWFAHKQGHWRDVAKRIEIRETRKLIATGYPLVMTGDMNERAAFFCPLTKHTGLHASNGGSHAAGRCHPPRRAWIDWILGSAQVEFSGYQRIRNHLVHRTSDHPMILNQVHIGPTPAKTPGR